MTVQYFIAIVEPEWDPDSTTDADYQSEWVKHRAFAASVTESGGTVLGGEAMQPVAMGFAVDPMTSARSPLVASGEVTTGFYLIELPDGADAASIIAGCPTGGHLEVRLVAGLPDAD